MGLEAFPVLNSAVVATALDGVVASTPWQASHSQVFRSNLITCSLVIPLHDSFLWNCELHLEHTRKSDLALIFLFLHFALQHPVGVTPTLWLILLLAVVPTPLQGLHSHSIPCRDILSARHFSPVHVVIWKLPLHDLHLIGRDRMSNLL